MDVRVAVAHGPLAAAEVDVAAARELPEWRATEYVTARALLRGLLDDMDADCRIETLASGRPYLPERPDLTVSLSHDGDWTAAAVGVGADVGVDVQVPLPASSGLLRRCCTPETREALDAMPAPVRDREFAWIWTVQEACVKAAGTGLAGCPWTIPVDVGQQTGSWRDYQWHSLRDQSVPVSYAYRAVTS
jgi:4'-phosphopantetheinyl transferase